MSGTVRAVVFDLDGTLIDSMPLVLRAYAHALGPFFDSLSEGEILARLGGPPERLFVEMLKGSAEVEEALQRLREFSLANWKLIQPFAGMNALLAELRQAGCAVAVWTGRERESTEWLMREHGVREHVRTFVCGDDMPSHKPDPAGLAEVLRRLEVGAADALFVGDADVDVLAGAALGVRTVFIQEDRVVDPVVSAKAWRRVRTPAEAYDVVRSELAASRRTGGEGPAGGGGQGN